MAVVFSQLEWNTLTVSLAASAACRVLTRLKVVESPGICYGHTSLSDEYDVNT